MLDFCQDDVIKRSVLEENGYYLACPCQLPDWVIITKKMALVFQTVRQFLTSPVSLYFHLHLNGGRLKSFFSYLNVCPLKFSFQLSDIVDIAASLLLSGPKQKRMQYFLFMNVGIVRTTMGIYLFLHKIFKIRLGNLECVLSLVFFQSSWSFNSRQIENSIYFVQLFG